jgi:predicted metal-binding membrane protein
VFRPHIFGARCHEGIPGHDRLLEVAVLVSGMSSAAARAGTRRPSTSREELGRAFAATRARIGIVCLLFGLAALAWWYTASRMSGMDEGPGSDLGTLGWFVGLWVVMMAAMMFPSVSPTVALYAQMLPRRDPIRPLIFAGGYLLIWGATGAAAYGLFEAGRGLFGSQLAWDDGGRLFAGAVLAFAALYELTPLKNACLSRCRSPLGFLVGDWRHGRTGALVMGTRHGAWCVGCCWALMAALFALGVMSLLWTALIAGVIALEKLLPWRRTATLATAALLLALAVALVASPDSIPGLVVPGGGAHSMGAMH